ATEVRRATKRAALAVELAATGHRRDAHLLRAHADMATSWLLIQNLHAEGKLNERACDHLRRRIDQIVACLEQLKLTPPEQWLALELAPLEEEAKDLDTQPERSPLKSLLVKVAAVARSLLSDEPSPPTAQPAQEKKQGA